MSKVFKNQGYYTITLDTGLDLTSATVTRILYKKPNGVKGYFTATKSGTSLTYQCSNADLDVSGNWQFQAYVEIGGLKGFGDFIWQNVYNPLL
jgi:hypothetical protein